MRDDEQACVLAHRTDPDRLRPAARGYVCEGHFTGLDRALTDLATFARDADEASYDETVSIAASGAPVTGTREKPLPVNVARLEHVIRVRGVMASWSQMVAEERGVAVPDSPEPAVTSGFLRLHLDWACGQEWTVEFDEDGNPSGGFAVEILALGRRAYSLLNPSGIRRIDIGPCREQLDNWPCDGQLSALVRKSDDLLPSSIVCDRCETEITADRWLTYGRSIVKTEEAA